jgi:Copper transport outer membrane protein, MctB
MINFRFHVVSLIAIFLALALGVVIGAGVIDRGVVDTLNSRLDRVEAKSDRIQSANDALSSENDQLGSAIGDMQPFAVSGRLAGDNVGVVAVRGVDGDRVTATITALQQADPTVTGTLWIEDKWKLESDDDIKALQTALGVSTKNKVTLRTEAWRQLADRLSNPLGVGGGGSSDLLAVLRDAGFLGFDAVGSATIGDFPGRDAGVVLVVGNDESVPAATVVVPAATALHDAKMPLVVAGVWKEVTDGPDRAAVVQPLRDSDLAKTVSTVDDLDQPWGPTTVTLALADLFSTPPVAGHYGLGPNAKLLPDPANA